MGYKPPHDPYLQWLLPGHGVSVCVIPHPILFKSGLTFGTSCLLRPFQPTEYSKGEVSGRAQCGAHRAILTRLTARYGERRFLVPQRDNESEDPNGNARQGTSGPSDARRPLVLSSIVSPTRRTVCLVRHLTTTTPSLRNGISVTRTCGGNDASRPYAAHFKVLASVTSSKQKYRSRLTNPSM